MIVKHCVRMLADIYRGKVETSSINETELLKVMMWLNTLDTDSLSKEDKKTLTAHFEIVIKTFTEALEELKEE